MELITKYRLQAAGIGFFLLFVAALLAVRALQTSLLIGLLGIPFLLYWSSAMAYAFFKREWPIFLFGPN
ncbi:hypothetical protein A2W54_03675 [Candidatus Giovannonibacteria bacterium RIFCSPHIGHO2_02_43_13]|uniref:Uncharacterized protein n=1 Tax=Candidatus Giovannonibacteria bacterium RIFCSPHIGHO2_02_43_13 TaxID=1798330 RepID=A0A1F5WRG6_9BACT|nr:MAG: hypothetical protein UW28_C0043G0008 [Parcubacteria group bacterium GW2011_GWA2_44_13]OGF74620.1 MAG: hypothetical protein A3E06_02775 [Candidatus Giovannonibacteria bacterium RIFCSPHIGHO2_12_FULL_44_42]OGF78177.1 MAG: hypothetical protein A2W54_03675 [Candidatus Giovannonibacteria bacterium RIFCSPHIGHO2_02_43_13]OGF89051.1 MAG: hypothetical protein A3I94_01865 [Candidatus Giovannonibacteria bacterium RIFCSPLOWO2_02_FULL_43_54]OGF96912.1 MAG: hypothetical protein A3H08_02880 [Candidatus